MKFTPGCHCCSTSVCAALIVADIPGPCSTALSPFSGTLVGPDGSLDITGTGAAISTPGDYSVTGTDSLGNSYSYDFNVPNCTPPTKFYTLHTYGYKRLWLARFSICRCTNSLFVAGISVVLSNGQSATSDVNGYVEITIESNSSTHSPYPIGVTATYGGWSANYTIHYNMESGGFCNPDTICLDAVYFSCTQCPDGKYPAGGGGGSNEVDEPIDDCSHLMGMTFGVVDPYMVELPKDSQSSKRRAWSKN